MAGKRPEANNYMQRPPAVAHGDVNTQFFSRIVIAVYTK